MWCGFIELEPALGRCSERKLAPPEKHAGYCLVMTRSDFLAPPSLRILGTQASISGAEPKLTSLNTHELPDGALVFVSAEKSYFYFDRDSTLAPDGVDVVQATGPGRFFRWSGSAASPSIDVVHEMIVPSVAGRNNYTIPVGNWFLNAIGETTLDIDSGAGYIPQAYGPDYAHLLRVTPPPTVADAAIGFSIVGGAVPAGWTLRFRWHERTLLVQPSVVAKVIQPPNYAAPWNSSSAVDFPNGVRIPEYPDVQVEFWRQTWRNGGQRGNMGVLRRDGKRYLPYFRGVLNQFAFRSSEFRPTQPMKRNHFRVCYYDPATGARSALSNDIIVVCNDQQADRVNGRFARTRGSVWIE